MADEVRRDEESGTQPRRMVDSDASGFEVFQSQRRVRALASDEISLSKTNILLSELLAERLAKAMRVVLLYNREKHEIGIRTATPDEHGYRISNRSISSRSFCQHFRIEERGRFKARVDGFGKVIVALRKADGEPTDAG